MDHKNHPLIRQLRNGIALVLCLALLTACTAAPGSNSYPVTSGAQTATQAEIVLTDEPVYPAPTTAAETSTLETPAETATTEAVEQPTLEPAAGGPEITLDTVADLQMASSLEAPGARSLAWASQGSSLVVTADADVLAFSLAGSALPDQGSELVSTAATRLVSSPSASLLAWTGEDQSLQVWDSTAGGEPRLLANLADVATGLEFSPDENRLAAASADNRIQFWNLNGGDAIEPWTLPYTPASLSFSPDGNRLGIVDPSTFSVHIYDVASGEEQKVLEWTEHASPVLYGVAFSPNWETLAWVARGTVLMMSVTTGESGITLGHEDFISDFSWSPDGSLFATAAAGTVDGNFTPLVTLWDTAAGGQARLLPLANPVIDLEFSPDGARLATLDSAGQVQIFSVVP